MILLVDAPAAVDLLVRSESGEQVRRFLMDARDVTLMTVAHLDAEVLSALARLHGGGVLTDTGVAELLSRLAALAMQRLPITQGFCRPPGPCATTSPRVMRCTSLLPTRSAGSCSPPTTDWHAPCPTLRFGRRDDQETYDTEASAGRRPLPRGDRGGQVGSQHSVLLHVS